MYILYIKIVQFTNYYYFTIYDTRIKINIKSLNKSNAANIAPTVESLFGSYAINLKINKQLVNTIVINVQNITSKYIDILIVYHSPMYT